MLRNAICGSLRWISEQARSGETQVGGNKIMQLSVPETRDMMGESFVSINRKVS